MRQLPAIILLATVLLFQQTANAQNNQKAGSGLQNTAWKSYIGDPVNDTMTIMFSTDTSYFRSSAGQVMVASSFNVSGDTVKVTDVSGQYACTGHTGTYKYSITAEGIKFQLIQDVCEGRASIITIPTWRRVK